MSGSRHEGSPVPEDSMYIDCMPYDDLLRIHEELHEDWAQTRQELIEQFPGDPDVIGRDPRAQFKAGEVAGQLRFLINFGAVVRAHSRAPEHKIEVEGLIRQVMEEADGEVDKT